MPTLTSHLIMFTGVECVKCHQMEPQLEQLEKEFNLKIDRLEVWHNAENADYMMKVANNRCMSIPMLYNAETDGLICGPTDYQELKKWAGIV